MVEGGERIHIGHITHRGKEAALGHVAARTDCFDRDRRMEVRACEELLGVVLRVHGYHSARLLDSSAVHESCHVGEGNTVAVPEHCIEAESVVNGARLRVMVRPVLPPVASYDQTPFGYGDPR